MNIDNNERRDVLDKYFISLCETYHTKILKYLYYSVGNIEDAKDLTQEVFVVVLEETLSHSSSY